MIFHITWTQWGVWSKSFAWFPKHIEDYNFLGYKRSTYHWLRFVERKPHSGMKGGTVYRYRAVGSKGKGI